jgi:hypothetical protein
MIREGDMKRGVEKNKRSEEEKKRVDMRRGMNILREVDTIEKVI